MSQTFERERLALFREHGFAGEGRWYSDASGRRTYAVVRGSGDVPTLLVHGGLAEASVWAMMAGQLDGCVMAVDRPGCGLSDPIDYSGLDYRADAASWLRGLCDAIGAARVDLVGNSMGGFFCMAFACAYPERVRRMVLPGAPAGLDRPLPLFLRLWGNPVLGGVIASMVAGLADPELLRRRVFRDLVAHPERVPVPVLQLAIAAARLPGAARTSRSMLRAVSTLGGWRRELMLRESMQACPVPTRFLWGARDAFAPPSSGEELAARMPHASIAVLDDVGHFPQLDAPEEVARLVSEFLGKADASMPALGVTTLDHRQ